MEIKRWKCEHYKTGYHDNDLAEDCIRCEVQRPVKYQKCNAAYQEMHSPKAEPDKQVKKPRNKNRKPPKADGDKKIYETCEGPLVENCKKCPEFEDCEGHLFSKKPRWVIDKYSRKLTPTEQKVLDCLEKYASFSKNSDKFGCCHPSHKEIAEVTGVSLTSIGGYIKKLDEVHGLVEKSFKQFNKGGMVTHGKYRLTYLIRQKELDDKKKKQKPST